MQDYAQADALLTGLVERYSPSREESTAVSYLVDEMRALGFRARIDEAGNAVGEWTHSDARGDAVRHIALGEAENQQQSKQPDIEPRPRELLEYGDPADEATGSASVVAQRPQ